MLVDRIKPCNLRCSGPLTEAVGLADETLVRMRGKIGDSHPLALCCAINLANCHGDAGDLDAAEAMERQTVPQLQEALGDDHPDVNALHGWQRIGRDLEAPN